jgi:hypothetical protein
VGDTQVIKVPPQDYNLCNKVVVPITSLSLKTNIALRKMILHVSTQKPNTPNPTTTNNKSNISISDNNRKPSTSTPIATNTKPNTPKTPTN